MARGRPPNLARNEARAAGLRIYVDPNPCFCGSDTKYVSNAQCVECLIAAGKAKYAALDPDAKAAVAARDHVRYQRRLLAGKQPRG